VKKKRVEVLAPAGSLEICKAVINAGADAVYLGGDLFGARAFAGNLNEEELIEAITYAHLRGRAIYLTVNTLLKNEELKQQLCKFLVPYYEAGLDAVIVQDMGVFKKIKAFFPDLAIHASTQMTITGAHSAALLKQMGASRIVAARELSLQELAAIHKACDIEIECFVHGALCYCYSGQCLLSSMNGPRSGNRGRCAQACRLGYEVTKANGEKMNTKREAYALSPKDLCTLKILPEIIEAGAYALKIEGRMKNVTYAAGVTAMYRKYVDLYLSGGKSAYKVSDADIECLMDIYNRGAFTTGYYDSQKGKTMMSVTRPNHMGTKALKVVENHNGCVTFKALTEIYRQDVFEIDAEHSFSSGENVHTGDTLIVNLPRKYKLTKGRVLNRTKNAAVVAAVENNFIKNNYIGKEKLNMELTAEAGNELRLKLSALGKTVMVTGNIAEQAIKRGVEEKTCVEKLSKLGNSPFVVGDIHIEIGQDVFIPSSQLNELRRRGIEQLCAAILGDKQRSFKAPDKIASNSALEACVASSFSHCDKKSTVIIAVSDIAACQSILAVDKDVFFKEIYVDYSICETERGKNLMKQLFSQGRHLSVMLSFVTTQKRISACEKLIKSAYKAGVDTFVVRNLEQLGLLVVLFKKLFSASIAQRIKVVLDANLYCWNDEAIEQYMKITEETDLQLERITLPYELAYKEIAAMSWKVPVELVVYGNIPVMISEQCLKKTYGKCDGKSETVCLNQHVKVSCMCKDCYNVIWSAHCLNLMNQIETIYQLGIDYIRYDLTAVNKVSASYSRLLKMILHSNEINGNNKTLSAWTGHFNSSVQ